MKETDYTLDENSWILKRPVAHRGLHTEKCPENSAVAFERAIAAGYPIELDVHMVSDGELVVFHDDNLKRMTGKDCDTESLSIKEILPLRLAGTEYGILTMREVLELVAGRVPLMIEIKNRNKVGSLENALAALLKVYKGEFAIQSFNPNSLAYFKDNAPGITCGLLGCDHKDSDLPFYKKFILKHLFLLKKTGAQFINYQWDELPKKRVEKTGLPVLCWTVKSQSDYEKVKPFVKNILFEGFIP